MPEYTLDQVKRLGSSGEGHFLEFKRKVDNPQKIVKELIAFSNSDGGKLLVGVADNGNLAGLNNPEGDWFILENAIRKHCRGNLRISKEFVPISSSKSVIVIDIPESRRKPNFYQVEKNQPKEVYIRVKDECVRASRELADLLSFERRRVFIEYGPEEEWLLSYIRESSKITLEDYRRLRKIPKRKASQILVRLTAAGVLTMIPGYGGEDTFKVT